MVMKCYSHPHLVPFVPNQYHNILQMNSKLVFTIVHGGSGGLILCKIIWHEKNITFSIHSHRRLNSSKLNKYKYNTL